MIKTYCGSCGDILDFNGDPVSILPDDMELDFEELDQVLCDYCRQPNKKKPFRWIGQLPGYEITEDGRIYSLKKGRRVLMKPEIDNYGYPSIKLTVDGKRRRFRVHRLVAFVHLGYKPDSDQVIRHLNGNKMIPHKNNLAWGTSKENAEDRVKHRGR